MKSNLILEIVIVILISIISSNYIFNLYKSEYVINNKNKIYFLQEGVYIDKDNVREVDAPSLTVRENNKYYSYLGMTLNSDIALKIKEIYNKKDINFYIKEVELDDIEFFSLVSQYDVLLSDAKNFEEISHILNTVLSTYEDKRREAIS